MAAKVYDLAGFVTKEYNGFIYRLWSISILNCCCLLLFFSFNYLALTQ